MITLMLNTRRQAGATQWSILDVFREDSWHFPQSEVPTKVFSPEPSMFFSSLQWECHCASGSVTRCCAHRCLLWPSHLTVISQPLNNNGNCFPPEIPRAVEWMALKVSMFARRLVQWKLVQWSSTAMIAVRQNSTLFFVQLHWTRPTPATATAKLFSGSWYSIRLLLELESPLHLWCLPSGSGITTTTSISHTSMQPLQQWRLGTRSIQTHWPSECCWSSVGGATSSTLLWWSSLCILGFPRNNVVRCFCQVSPKSY